MAEKKSRNTLRVRVPSDREVVLARVFEAPRQLVFEAHTSCEHVQHWWGRHGSTFVSCHMDFRPGGTWRYVAREADGSEHAFRGEYREIVPNERIVSTFEYEGYPGHISVETQTFEDHDGKTILTGRSLFDSIEDRDGMLAAGMEVGAGETYDRLDDYLASK